MRVEGAGFYARLSDAIVSVPTLFYPCTGTTLAPPVPVPGCEPQAVTQSRNAGAGDYYGVELALAASPLSGLRLGANYSWIEREFEDPSNSDFRPVGVPTHKAFLWAEWTATPGLRVYPSLELASERWLVNTAGTRFFRGGDYALAAVRLDYELAPGLLLGLGGRNLFDDNHALADGFPEEGRSFYLSASWRR